MAAALPESQFFGIDLATGPVESAHRVIDHTGLRNVQIRAMDLMEITPEFGAFDYIIAHGFYSWVPQEAREKLLAVCRENLNPNGIAFVSYNTYPAGHLREIFRNMILFHLEKSREDSDQINQGKDLLKFTLDSVDDKGIWKSVITSELERLCTRDDNVTYHDELSPSYSPVYFKDFIISAEQHGLQFVAEAKLREMIDPIVKPDVLQRLRAFADGDEIRYQQYLDFILFRGFRGSLLCHREIPLSRNELPERVSRLWLATPLRRSKTNADGSVEFANSSGPGTITTNNIILIAALEQLERAWPHARRFEDLLPEVRSKMRSELQGEVRGTLGQAALALASKKLLELRSYCVPLAGRISERPKVSPLARLQAAEGSLITTLLHSEVKIEDDGARRLLQLLDGTQAVNSLAAGDRKTANNVRNSRVDDMLTSFYHLGLLMA
jgi:SAM-dependent methyltransferase